MKISAVESLPVLGKVLRLVTVGDDSVKFFCDDGSAYVMYHEQDCCETVEITQIDGDFSELYGDPLRMAEAYSNYYECFERNPDGDDQHTFYKFATVKGYVTVRWEGSSNGYYSTEVTFREEV